MMSACEKHSLLAFVSRTFVEDYVPKCDKTAQVMMSETWRKKRSLLFFQMASIKPIRYFFDIGVVVLLRLGCFIASMFLQIELYYIRTYTAGYL